jgi:arylsulfatase
VDKKPNIVMILVDNVGWGDWGVYGGPTATPRIDALAAEGTRFNNYTVESQCTPTRSAIMTGRMPVRSGTYKVPFPGEGASGLSPWEYTLANLLSDAGYATAAYGKWHLGEIEGRLPIDQGFDQWWGIKNSTDEAGYTSYAAFRAIVEAGAMEAPKIWEGKKGEKPTVDRDLDLKVRPFLDEMIVERASKFIKDHASSDNPFFTYIALTHVHPPEAVHPDFDQESPARLGLYADIMAEMDHRVGQIVDAVEAAGVSDDTVIILSSDNATGGVDAVPGGSNGPWRGNFMTPPYEGSWRVPAIVRWPKQVPQGRFTEEMLAAVDWMPTIAGLVGESGRVPDDRPIDGVDASKFLVGDEEKSGRDTAMFFGPDANLMGVKWNNIKVIFEYGTGIGGPIEKAMFPRFYDLTSDPGEKDNLFSTRLDNGWMLGPAIKAITEFRQSAVKYPNIKPGEDFSGYRGISQSGES